MNTKKNIGFVGSSYKEFIDRLADDYTVIAFSDKASEEKFPESVERVIMLDFSSKKALFEDLKKLSDLTLVAFVATYENAILPKAWLCEWFHLPGLSEESALISTDKQLMRQRFQEICPQVSPAFRAVETWEEVVEFTRTHSFPLMIKPSNLFKSLLVTKNDTMEELQHNFEKTRSTIQAIYQKEHVKRPPVMIVEEYMSGPSFSIEVFTDREGNTRPLTQPSDLIMGRDLGIPDNFNYLRTLPSKLSIHDIKRIQEVAEIGVRALEFTSSPAHVELIMTEQGPKIIEIGARVGGYRPRMYGLSFGVDLFQAQVDVALGTLPNVEERFQKYTAVYELFSPKEGNFLEVANWDRVLKLPSLYYGALKKKPGVRTGLSSDGYRAVAVIILCSSSSEEFGKDRAFIENNVAVSIE